MAVDAGYLGDLACCEIPDMEIATAGGEKDFGACGGLQCRGCEGRRAYVETRDERIRRWSCGREVMQVDGRSRAGG